MRILEQHNSRSFVRVQPTQYAGELPEHPALLTCEPLSVSGETKVNAGKRGCRQLGLGQVSANNVPNVS